MILIRVTFQNQIKMTSIKTPKSTASAIDSKLDSKHDSKLDGTLEAFRVSQESASPLNRYDPTINIAIVGAVSAGKSTLTNALFVDQYSDMAIKRTTTMPQVYVETQPKNSTNKNKGLTKEESTRIREHNRNINKKYMDSTADGTTKLTVDDVSEIYYAVPKIVDLFNNFPNETCVAIYDLPGLNDSMTKDVYHSYVKKNFHKFDVVIFLVDINSSLNTSDETSILRLVLEGIKNNRTTYGIETSLMVLVNKCDDLKKSGKQMIPVDEELQDMYKQVETIVNTVIKEIDPQIKFTSTCISCEDSYIYRSYNRDDNVQLDAKYTNKMGSNEVGIKPWAKLSEDQKKKKIKEIFASLDYSDRIEQCGFKQFNTILQTMLDKTKQYTFLMNHIKYALQQIIAEASTSKDPEANATIANLKVYEGIVASIQTRYGLKRDTTMIDEYVDQFIKNYKSTFSTYLSSFMISDTQNHAFMRILKQTVEKIISVFTIKPNNLDQCASSVTKSINDYLVKQINNGSTDIGTIIESVIELKENGFGKTELITIIRSRIDRLIEVNGFTSYKTVILEDDGYNRLMDIERNMITVIDKIVKIFNLNPVDKLDIISENMEYIVHMFVGKTVKSLKQKRYFLSKFMFREKYYAKLMYCIVNNISNGIVFYGDVDKFEDPVLETEFINTFARVYPKKLINTDDLFDIDILTSKYTVTETETKANTKTENIIKNAEIFEELTNINVSGKSSASTSGPSPAPKVMPKPSKK